MAQLKNGASGADAHGFFYFLWIDGFLYFVSGAQNSLNPESRICLESFYCYGFQRFTWRYVNFSTSLISTPIFFNPGQPIPIYR
jgi:hypothetical protein